MRSNPFAISLLHLGGRLEVASQLFKGNASDRWVRRFFLANALVTPMIALVYFLPTFSIALLFLGAPWMITAPGSFLMLALWFKRGE